MKTNNIKHIATALLFDRNGKLLIYLRDNKPTIPFPNYWDLFGGHVENGESPEQALTREVKEELNLELKQYWKFRDYECTEGDVYPNIKHVFWSIIDDDPTKLVLHEGQKLTSIDVSKRHKIKFANILSKVVDEFVLSATYKQMREKLKLTDK